VAHTYASLLLIAPDQPQKLKPGEYFIGTQKTVNSIVVDRRNTSKQTQPRNGV
jgi:hypothetical protein